jgi:hypothetical protein
MKRFSNNYGLFKVKLINISIKMSAPRKKLVVSLQVHRLGLDQFMTPLAMLEEVKVLL